MLFKRYHVPFTIYHIPYRTHRFGNFDGVRHFSTSLVNSPSSDEVKTPACRHTNLDGILLLLRLWRWWHTRRSLWGPLHGGRFSSFFLDRWGFMFNHHLFSLFWKNRAQFRREANQADNKAATVAVDSLINFEAVKVRKSLTLTLRR